MGVKKYFKKEFQLKHFGLEHERCSDFYLTCFQTGRSYLPLLCLRTIIFLGCLGIMLASLIMMWPTVGFNYWAIFLTHWGLIFITCTSFLAMVVSLIAYFGGPNESSYELPWYVKLYWVFFNLTTPIAFFITVFYWSFLQAGEDDYSINRALDVFIHAINSVMMLVLILVSRHPVHLLQFYQSLCATILYLIFSLIFYYAGGISPFGTHYIYPMLDWSKPGIASVTVVASAIMLILMHILLVLITLARDALTKSCRRNSRSLSISNEAF